MNQAFRYRFDTAVSVRVDVDRSGNVIGAWADSGWHEGSVTVEEPDGTTRDATREEESFVYQSLTGNWDIAVKA